MLSVRINTTQPVLSGTLHRIAEAIMETLEESVTYYGEVNKDVRVDFAQGGCVITNADAYPVALRTHHRRVCVLIVFKSEAHALREIDSLQPMFDAVSLEHFRGFISHSDRTYNVIEFRECDPSPELAALAKTRCREVHIVMRRVV